MNRKALRDYLVLQRAEAGLVLQGTEVKSVRHRRVNLSGSFVRIEDGEACVQGMHIAHYEQGNRFNHDPVRCRKLLLHRKEIRKLQTQLEEKGLALVPLSLYLRNRKIKMEIGVCRGKKLFDKRETLRRKTLDRDAARAAAQAARRS